MTPESSFHVDPEKAAEDYLMERLHKTEVGTYEAHIRCCADCTRDVEWTQAMIDAAKRLASARVHRCLLVARREV